MKSTPVKPCLPVAPYIGGKRNLARLIIRQIEAIPHAAYFEPFVGMGGVFLRRRQRPEAEAINDAGRDVANLFRILQRHYQPFIDHLRWKITSRAEFERLAATKPETLTDLERAARFLYLQRIAFGGKIEGQSFGVASERAARFNISRLEPMLEDVHERLSGVVIECLDYKDFIARYDHKAALFYIDPPYHGNEHDYGAQLFNRAEFERLEHILRRLKGRFILSLNDVPAVRETFMHFRMKPVTTTYTLSAKGNAKKAGELLISNARLRA